MNLNILLRALLHLRILRRRDHWTREQVLSYRDQQLRELRDYAYAHSAFYQHFHQGLYDAPLSQLPILTKSVMMQHFDQLVTDRRLKIAPIKAFIDNNQEELNYQGHYWINTTSGSTGNPGIFVFNHEEWAKVMASYSRMQELSGLNLNLLHPPKRALVSSLKTTHMSALVARTIGDFLMPMLHLDAAEKLEEIVTKLNKFQPDHLVGYASILHLLANEQLKGRLRIAPTMVFSASEVLTSDMRTTIENAFGQVLFNEYAATETGSIAGECPYHTGLHLMEDHIYVEVVDGQNQPVAEGQYGDKLLLSVLFNKTQPLIRYELSDSIKLSQQACPCGRPFLLIADIQGRREDFLYFQGVGREPITIHPLKIDAMMEKVPVTAWQIVLEGKVLTILLAGKDPDYDANGVKTSFEALAENEGIPSLEVLVKEVDAIPKTYSGKAPLIRNLNLKIPSSV